MNINIILIEYYYVYMDTSKVDTDIQKIIIEWDRHFKAAIYNKETDNKTHLSNILNFFKHIQNSYPILQKWCASYLIHMTFKEKVENWLKYGLENIEDNHVFRKHWALFFRNKHADIIKLDGETYDISYPHFLYLKSKRKKEVSLRLSNREEIINIHKGVLCDNQSDCFLCEEQEELWKKEMRDRYKSYKNIFMDRELRNNFTQSWLKSAFEQSDVEQEKIHYVWPPVRIFSYTHIFTKIETLSYDEYINVLLKDKWNTYYGYHFRPKTTSQEISDLDSSTYIYKLPDNIFNKNGVDILSCNSTLNSELFVFLSHSLKFIPYILELDINRCKELLSYCK